MRKSILEKRWLIRKVHWVLITYMYGRTKLVIKSILRLKTQSALRTVTLSVQHMHIWSIQNNKQVSIYCSMNYAIHSCQPSSSIPSPLSSVQFMCSESLCQQQHPAAWSSQNKQWMSLSNILLEILVNTVNTKHNKMHQKKINFKTKYQLKNCHD